MTALVPPPARVLRAAAAPSKPTAVSSPVRRRPGSWGPTDVAALIGCAAAVAVFVLMVSSVLVDTPGWLADLALWFVLFLGAYYVVIAERLGRLAAIDRLVAVVVCAGALLLVVPLTSLLVYVFARGLPQLRLAFFTHDMAGVTPQQPATAGGGLHAIVGTLEQAGLAMVLVMPLGVLCAVFLNETRSHLRRPVRIVVDAISGLPSIVAGLFIYSALILSNPVKTTLFNFNGLMASLALSLVMLPTVTRTVEVVLRLVPDGLREASLALGASRARTVWSVVLPTARSGVTTAVVLGLARIVGETAPLLFTSFGSDLLNRNPFSGVQESLPLFVFRNVKSAQQAEADRGYVGAVVLILVVLVLFSAARLVGRDRSSRGARRRIFRRSA